MIDKEDDIGFCPCGGAWFEVLPPEDADENEVGVVCVDTEGEVTGYAGRLACAECYREWAPNNPGRHLRLVR